MRPNFCAKRSAGTTASGTSRMATQQNSSGRIGGRLTCRATGRALRSILLGGALRAFGDRETDDQHDDAGDKNETQEAAPGAMSQNYGQIIHDFAFRFRFPGKEVYPSTGLYAAGRVILQSFCKAGENGLRKKTL